MKRLVIVLACVFVLAGIAIGSWPTVESPGHVASFPTLRPCVSSADQAVAEMEACYDKEIWPGQFTADDLTDVPTVE